jgi:hypothetical protein
VRVEPAGRDVDIGDDWRVPERIRVVRDNHGGVDVELTAEYRPDTGRYEPEEVVVRRHSLPVTGETLRMLPIAAMLRDAVAAYMAERPEMFLPQGDLRELAAAGPTDDTLRAVARVYRAAALLGDPPARRVVEAFGIPRGTASGWVMRARDRGLLTARDPRGGRRVVRGTARAELGFSADAEGK